MPTASQEIVKEFSSNHVVNILANIPCRGWQHSTRMRTWLYPFPPESMLKHLLFWRKKRDPSWINEFYHSGFRALVGVAHNEVGGFHHVIKLQKRDEYGKYKDVELFRNYEWPAILTLFRNIESEAKSLVAA